MKAIKLVAVAILGATTLGVATPAFAGEVVDSKKTDTTVLIEDAGEGTTADLKLKEVPTKFDFKTALNSKGEYKLTSTPTGKFVAFNNKMNQEWSVKSTVDNAELKLSDAEVATVEGFRINGQELRN